MNLKEQSKQELLSFTFQSNDTKLLFTAFHIDHLLKWKLDAKKKLLKGSFHHRSDSREICRQTCVYWKTLISKVYNEWKPIKQCLKKVEFVQNRGKTSTLHILGFTLIGQLQTAAEVSQCGLKNMEEVHNFMWSLCQHMNYVQFILSTVSSHFSISLWLVVKASSFSSIVSVADFVLLF